jgi:hypothetical protein
MERRDRVKENTSPDNFFTFGMLNSIIDHSQVVRCNSLPEVFRLLKEEKVRDFTFTPGNKPINRLQTNTLDIHFREDFNNLIRILGVSPRMIDPREYGLPYGMTHHAGFLWTYQKEKIWNLASLFGGNYILARGNIVRTRD